MPKLLRKTYFIIFNSLGQQSSRKEFHFVLFQTLKKIAGKILTVAFVSGANTYICQLWNWIHRAGSQKNQIDGGKWWWNRYESFTWVSEHNELYKHHHLIFTTRSIKIYQYLCHLWKYCVNIYISAWSAHLILHKFSVHCWGQKKVSYLLTCERKSCIINEMRKEGSHLGRWSNRISLLIWSHTVNSSASIFQMHQVEGKIHLPKTTAWLKIKTCNLTMC